LKKKTELYSRSASSSSQPTVKSQPQPEIPKSQDSFILEPKKVPLLVNQKYDLLCPSELKITLNGDFVDIRVRCEHPDLYLFSEFRHDRKLWNSFNFGTLKKLLASKDWPQFSDGTFLDKKYYEDDDYLFDVGVKYFITSGKPELHELTYVMTKPAPRAPIGIPSSVSSSKVTTTTTTTTTSVKPQQTEPPKLNFKFCGECGARNSSSDKFCGKCGGKI